MIQARPSSLFREFNSFQEVAEYFKTEKGIPGWGYRKIINLLKFKKILDADPTGVYKIPWSPFAHCIKETSTILRNGREVNKVLVNKEGVELIEKLIRENPGYKCKTQEELDDLW